MKDNRGRQETMKLYSRAQIVMAVCKRGPVCRKELAKATGLSFAWISRVVDELLSEGVLVETSSVAGARGRPGMLLEISGDGPMVAGIWLAPETAEIAVANQAGEFLARRSVEYSKHGDDVDAMLSAVVAGINSCAVAAGSDLKSLKSIGVSVAGWVNPMLGVVECMGNRRGWEGVPIERILQEKTGVRVFAENDVRAGALSRHLFSSERSSGAALYVYVGLGIGAALAGSDELLRGAHNLAGLLSYTVVDCQKQVPGSRQHGSLEDLASDAAFIKSIWPDRQLDPAEMSAEEHVSLTTRAYEMAKSGDVVAASALMSVTRYLGLAIVNAISLLDPKIVFVCGTLVDIAQDEVVDLIRREALQHVYPGAQGVEIRPLSDSYEFLVRGAVGLVLWQPYEGLLRKGLKLVTN